MDAPVSADLLALLVCPLSRAPLHWDGQRLVSRDPATRLAYPVEGGVPVLLPGRGTALTEDEWRAALAPG